jgi:hypothetical protein
MYVIALKSGTNVLYRLPEQDGAGSSAWATEDGSVIAWSTPSGLTPLYADPELQTPAFTTVSRESFGWAHRGYWESLSVDSYTAAEQRNAENPVYTWHPQPWPMKNGYIRMLDYRTLMPTSIGGSSVTYIPDNINVAAGTATYVSYTGGNMYQNTQVGMFARACDRALSQADVRVGFRLSC